MLSVRTQRLMEAYVTIYLACHRQHVRSDEEGDAITDRQVSVLHHLDAAQGKTLSKLAEHLGVGRSTMSLMVNRLVQRGYVKQQRDTEDGRRTSLTLTRKGLRVREQNTVLDPELLESVFRRMPAARLEASLAGMEELARYAGVVLRQRKRERDA